MLNARLYCIHAVGWNAIETAINILVAALPAPWFEFLPCQLRGPSRSMHCKERWNLNPETHIQVRREFPESQQFE